MAKRPRKKKVAGRERDRKIARDPIVARTTWLSSEWLWSGILLLAVIAAYSPVWSAGCIWDDEALVTKNPTIVDPAGLKAIWTTRAADICPLTLTTFWIEYRLWGATLWPYHLMNVFQHGAVALLLWRVLLRLRIPGAWLGAAIWALHPVQVESVAWISEMKNTESGIFYLCSILCFLKTPGMDNRAVSSGYGCYGLTILFAALAMASKSSTVILPLALCLCAWWIEGRWNWRSMAGILPIFLMSIVAGLVSVWTQKLHLEASPDAQLLLNGWQRLASAGDAIWFYLGKLIWPYPLMAIYPRWQVDAGELISYLPLLAAIILVFVLWVFLRTGARPWFFAFAYFLAALIPVLGLVNNTYSYYSFVADHFQYLASMGPLALAGAGMVWIANIIGPPGFYLKSLFGAGLLLILGTLSWYRAGAFENEITLWTDTLAKNPTCWLGYNNLGKALSLEGRADEAIADYQKALEIYPNYAMAYFNIGCALAKKGQVDQAIAHYEKALKIDPNYVQAQCNLGFALFTKGQVDESIATFNNVLVKDPDLAEAHYNLGIALIKKGNLDEAKEHFQKTLEIDPRHEGALNNLGAIFFQRGQWDAAIGQFQKAIEVNPDDADTHSNLGLAFFQKGQLDQAIDQFQAVFKINPNDASAHATLGVALMQKGELEGAIDQLQQALRLQPTFPYAQDNLEKAQTMARQRAMQK